MKLPPIPAELITQLDQVVQRFQSKLLTRSCVPLSTGVSPSMTKATKITDELVDIRAAIKELWPADPKPEREKFLAKRVILAYCLVWSYWGLTKHNKDLHRLALTVYGCSIYTKFFRVYFQYCDDQKFQMALQRASIRSHYYNKTHMALVDKVVENQLAKRTPTTDHIYSLYEVLVNTIRQSMRILAHIYYEEPRAALEPKIDISNVLRVIESSWDFPNEETTNEIIKRYVLRKVSFICLQSFIKRNKTTLLRFFESAIYKHAPTASSIRSKTWLKKVMFLIYKNPEFKIIVKQLQQKCNLTRPNNYLLAFFEYTHERLKIELK
jgi:hypothetical protein